jgi:PKD repeat protein
VVAVSMSWGMSEYAGESGADAHLTTPLGHNGVTFVAASGDDGGQPLSPSTSPNAVAVGGTSLFINSAYDFSSETGWFGSGGGISAYNPQPAYQNGVVSSWSATRRTGPDVAYNADPWDGFAVYNSSDGSGWDVVGGTSAGTPQWAALVAIADQGRALKGLGSLDGPKQTLPTLYQMPGIDFNDITVGSNFQYSCTAGYDLVTGLGSPHADLVVNDLVQAGTLGPFAVTVVPISTTEGQAFSGAVASVRDTYSGDTASSLAARINWGDGTTSTGTIVSNGRGGFLVDGTHTYAVAGKYSVGVTVTRSGGQSTSSKGTATVVDAPLEAYGFDPLSLTVGDPQSALVGWFIDGDKNAGAADFKVAINWGDGTSSPGRLVSRGYGWFDVYGDHSYAKLGTYNVQFAIQDVGGSSASASSRVTVEDAIWVASGDLLFQTQGQTFTATVATFSYANPTATASIFTAAINWGDGATSAGTIQPNGYGGFNVVANHTYSRAGTYTVHVGLKDIYGSSLVVDATAYVSAAAQATTASRGHGLTGAVASLSTIGPSAIDSPGTPDPVGILDEALASLGGASGPRRRWATT